MYEELIQPIPNAEFFQPSQRRETILSNQVEEISSRQFFTEVAAAILKLDVISDFPSLGSELVNNIVFKGVSIPENRRLVLNDRNASDSGDFG